MNASARSDRAVRRRPARRVGRLCKTWHALQTSLARAIPARLHPRRSLIARMRRDIRGLLDSDLESSSRSHAGEIARNYLSAGARRRMIFVRVLAHDFGASIDTRQHRAGGEGAVRDRPTSSPMLQSTQPPRLIVMRRLAELPDGLRLLMGLRGDLMDAARADGSMRAVEEELHRLLAAYFNVDLLEVRRVTWRSPEAVLKKLIEHEAVHEIHGWQDLRNRLDADRRCFALFHPRMPDEPLVFVEVALCDAIAGDIGALLDEHAPLGDPLSADTAVFYSISNCHRGLAGTSLGQFLITRAVGELAVELPGLKIFVTLSPIPGFANWLKAALDRDATPSLTSGEREGLQILQAARRSADTLTIESVRDPLMRLGAHYLMRVRRRDGKRAADAVAHFHLRNGARIERLDWLADRSEKGLRQSYGLMVNYRYEPAMLAKRAAAYVEGGVIGAAPEIEALAETV
ncbi:MAG TPA: malonyl-CoA decarboxylase family protein [Candidatus Binataceae bacterium]|nr:malonyl-CoA decarboxylase family protein [Candidatus Binataceae bacterium]